MRLINHTYQNKETLQRFIDEALIKNTNSVLVQCFDSHQSSERIAEVQNTLSLLLPDVPFIGTSTAGIIHDGHIYDHEIILAFTIFDKSDVRTRSFIGMQIDQIGNELLQDGITERTRLMVVYANPYRFDSTRFLELIQRISPQLVVCGGNAGDDFRFESCRVFSDEMEDADIVIALIDSDVLRIESRYLLNWESIGQEMTVTSAEGITVHEINYQPALSIYRHYLGNEVADQLLSYGIEFPLIYENKGVEVARALVGVDEETGSIQFAGEIPQGYTVRFGYANIEHITEKNFKDLQQVFSHQHEAIYVYTCGSRRQLLGHFLDDELSIISQIASTTGFITYGEFFHNAAACQNGLLNITTTMVVMDENISENDVKLQSISSQKDKRDVTLKALSTLISQTSRDLDDSIHYLQQFKNAVNDASIFSIANERGIITEVNQNFERISGYTNAELIGAPHSLIRSDEMSKETFRDMWQTIKSGKTWKGMVKNTRKDKTSYYVLTQISPIFNNDGSFREYIAIRNDVTELEEYKHYLKHELDTTNHNYQENLFYMKQYEEAVNSTIAILKTDTSNLITYANELFCELSGYTYEELKGKNCEELQHHKHRFTRTRKRIAKQLSNSQTVNEIMTNITKDGKEYILNNLFYPVKNLNGEIIEYLQVMYDITEIVKLNKEIIDTQKEVVMTMGAIGETRSKETGLHVKRVAEYSYLLARLSGFDEDNANLIKQASPMHDIGKVAIPDAILNKPGKLTVEEFDIMKTHAALGHEMLRHSERVILKASALIAYTHHEKYDGSGYPQGLKGEDIPIFGRITTIADVFDALGHDRVYKKAWPLEQIYELFRKEQGKHFDPILIDLFFEHLDDFLRIKALYEDHI